MKERDFKLVFFIIWVLLVWFFIGTCNKTEPSYIPEADTLIVVQPPVKLEYKSNDMSHTPLYEHIKSNHKDSFVRHLNKIARRLDIPYIDLITFLYIESRINYKAINKHYLFKDGTRAYGFIQMTPIARKHYNISYSALRSMNEFEQLDEVVFPYLNSKKHKIHDFHDLCQAGYLPAFMNKPDSFRFPQVYVDGNPRLGKTMGEYREFTRKEYNKIHQL